MSNGKVKTDRVIGLMSGTSLDGVDACCVDITFDVKEPLNKPEFSIVAIHSVAMPQPLKEKLLNLQSNTPQSANETVALICQLNFKLAELFAEVVNGLIEINNLDRHSIHYIGSHGQTIWHQPPNNKGLTPSTLQIGDISVIAQRTGLKTIGNFRTADMAAGGQGAPLVCLTDQLLFQDDGKSRCIHNLGGISNLTVLLAKKLKQPVTAFDTGPANSLIDLAMQQYYNQPYDPDGETAALGHVHQPVLSKMLAIDYFNQPPPKTTGRELFGPSFLDLYQTQLQPLAKQDAIATLTELTIESIAKAYGDFVFKNNTVDEIVFGGGGTKNSYLMARLKEKLLMLNPDLKIATHQDYGVPDQYKEAMAFGILAWANQNKLAGNIPSCTGAKKRAVLGQVAYP